jgi:hypothetical protein
MNALAHNAAGSFLSKGGKGAGLGKSHNEMEKRNQ